MKKLEIILRPEKLEIMKKILLACDAKGAMFTRISGFGNQKGKEYKFKGVTYFENVFQKTKVETIVDDEKAQKIIECVLEEIPDGEIGDGKIFVYDVDNVYRIRTGEHGEGAI